MGAIPRFLARSHPTDNRRGNVSFGCEISPLRQNTHLARHGARRGFC
ncbi:hypothetical protein BOSE46_90380 [Bosea sp. 46]|nr:hypothetical protein BOSE46_90380 [Bosea sp. 46]